jgi:hypothetical protein
MEDWPNPNLHAKESSIMPFNDDSIVTPQHMILEENTGLSCTASQEPMGSTIHHPTVTFPISCFTFPPLVDDGSAPKLNLAELTIIALAVSPARILSISQIIKWITSTFSYYRNLTYYHQSNNESTASWMNQVEKLLHQYDFPTTPVYSDGEDSILFHLDNGGEWFFLPKTRSITSNPFPLFKLPPELRSLIYHWSLYRGLPRKHGWVIDSEYTAHRLDTLWQDDHKPEYLYVLGPGEWELRTPPMDKVLALLSVNKQIKKEATPVFYRSNSFYFNSCRTLHSFLLRMPSRFKYVRNIILNYDPPLQGGHCTRTFAHLRKTKVRNIHIFVDENKLMDANNGFGTVDRLPGIKELSKLRGLDNISFEGNSREIMDYLARRGIQNNKKEDSTDDDERAVVKFKADQREYLRVIKRARKERIKKDKHEARVAKADEDSKARAVKKRLRAEAKALREEERRGKTEARRALVEKKKREKLKLRNKQIKEKQKAEEAKATRGKAVATKAMFGKSKGKRLHDLPESSEEPDSESETETETELESEDEYSPPPVKKAKVNKVAAKKCARTKRPIQAKTKEIVDISSDKSSTDEESSDAERSSSSASSPLRSKNSTMVRRPGAIRGKGRVASRTGYSVKPQVRKTRTGAVGKKDGPGQARKVGGKAEVDTDESDMEWA